MLPDGQSTFLTNKLFQGRLATDPTAHRTRTHPHPSCPIRSYLLNNRTEKRPCALRIWFSDKELSGMMSAVGNINILGAGRGRSCVCAACIIQAVSLNLGRNFEGA